MDEEDFIAVKSYLSSVQKTLNTFRKEKLSLRVIRRFLLRLDTNLASPVRMLPPVSATSAEVPAAKQDASTEVDLSLFSSSAGSVTESPFLLHPTDEASSSYSFLGYCSVFSLLVGCTYLGYLLIGYFLVPLPPAECLLNTDLLPELSSSVPPVSISNPDSDSSLPSTNTLIIVSVGVTVLVITLWCCSVPVPFVPLLV